MADDLGPVSSRRRPLSARFIETVSKPGKYFDVGIPGLFLRIDRSGRKYWVQRITINGRRRELGLGNQKYYSLKEARLWALDNKAKILRGTDPTIGRKEEMKKLTFSDAVNEFLPKKLGELTNDKHKAQWVSTLTTYAMPVLGQVPIADIGVNDVLRCLQPIWIDKNETASRVRSRIEAVLSWATVAGHRKGDNPARWKNNLSHLLPKGDRVRSRKHHPALSQTDAPIWWLALIEKTSISARALQFLTLTASRSGEVLGARWPEFDLDKAIWTLPAKRTKMNREHRVPLPRAAIEILKSLPRVHGVDLLFPSPRNGKMSDMALSKMMKGMHATQLKLNGSGFVDRITKRPAVPHGLRSTFRDWAAEVGVPRELAETALAHRVGSDVERAYQRSDMLERRRAIMDRWHDFLIAPPGF